MGPALKSGLVTGLLSSIALHSLLALGLYLWPQEHKTPPQDYGPLEVLGIRVRGNHDEPDKAPQKAPPPPVTPPLLNEPEIQDLDPQETLENSVDESNQGNNDSENLDFENATGMAQGDFTPSLLAWLEPQYPEQAKKRNLEGDVVLRFWVTTEGQIDRVEVVSSTRKIFEDSALKAAQEIRFTKAVGILAPNFPGLQTFDLRVRFRLK